MQYKKVNKLYGVFYFVRKHRTRKFAETKKVVVEMQTPRNVRRKVAALHIWLWTKKILEAVV